MIETKLVANWLVEWGVCLLYRSIFTDSLNIIFLSNTTQYGPRHVDTKGNHHFATDAQILYKGVQSTYERTGN